MESRTIKKYPNRRLYDTERSCYVTLDDLKKLLVKGVDIQVVDSETNEDITRGILIQIITEHESGEKATFTTEMLAQIIRLSNDTMQQVFARYLDQSLRVFLESQAFAERALSSNAFSDIARRNIELWQAMQESALTAAGFKPSAKKENARSKRAK
jgi:polyhydroxyalkanoate synthesis repressor PhaR